VTTDNYFFMDGTFQLKVDNKTPYCDKLCPFGGISGLIDYTITVTVIVVIHICTYNCQVQHVNSPTNHS